MIKRATQDCIGARVVYKRTGATGTITAIEPGRYHDSVVICTDGHNGQPGIEMVRSVEDCAIRFKRQKVQLFDRVTVVDFQETLIGVVLGITRNYLLVRSDDDQTFWEVERRLVAKVERAVRVEWAAAAEAAVR